MTQLALLEARLAPATRGDCADGPRPCRATTCRYHLWRVEERAGRPHHRTLGFANRALPIVRQHSEATCALDVVQSSPDGMTLDAIAAVLGGTKQRIEQVEKRALRQVVYTLYVIALARIAGMDDEVEELRLLGVQVDDIDPELVRAEMVRRKTLESIDAE
jgi:hypothetical protein